MRPGQAAPEFLTGGGGLTLNLTRFNEAGAGCPGIPLRPPLEVNRMPYRLQ